MIFSVIQLSNMLNEIGIYGRDRGRVFNGQTAFDGAIAFGHPIIDICALGEFADAHGGRDMSLENWLRERSSYPLETWKFYMGIEGD